MEGFRALRKRPFADLATAYRRFTLAGYSAKRGKQLLYKAGIEISSQYRWYLFYWKHVSAVGLFSSRGQFKNAHKHLDLAFKYASLLPTFRNSNLRS